MKNRSSFKNSPPGPAASLLPLVSRRQAIGTTLLAGSGALLAPAASLLASPAEATAPANSSKRRLTGIIDVHAHALFGIGAQPPLENVPQWSVEQALAAMDEQGVAASILSIPFAANAAEGAKACDIARRTNERLAEIVARHPTRFGALATIPGRTMDGALQEMAYALDTLGLDGVGTTTSINDVYLGDPRYDVWFEEMNQRGVTLFVHPWAAKASEPVNLGIDVSMLEFMFDTTRMLTNMVFGGAKQRFANIKIITTHGGGAIPYLVARLQTLERIYGTGAGRPPITPEEIGEGFGSFYYDLTASTSSAQLYALQQWVPTSQLLMGFDNPFMPTWSAAAAIKEVESWKGFTDSDLSQLAHGTAAQLYPALAKRLMRGAQ